MRGTWLVFKKEVIEFTKDRKTMFFTLAMPIILYPLLFGMLGKLTRRDEQKVRSTPTRVALIDPSGALEPHIRSSVEDFEIVPSPASGEEAKEAIKGDQLEMLVTLGPSASEDIAGQKTIAVEVLYNKVEKSGQVAMQRLERVLHKLDKSIVASRLEKLGASAQLAVPTEIRAMQVGGEELFLAKMLGTIMPYMLMLMLFAGSMQLGVYVTAGERERGTLITLLATGLPRREIIWGKMAYIFIMGIVVSIINIGSMAFSMGVLFGGDHAANAKLASGAANELAQSQALGLVAAADPLVIALTLLLMVPLGLLFSNLIIFFGVQAKNTQEAGTSMMPVLLFVMFLSIFSMAPGIEKMGFLPYVPIVNISLAIRKLFAQQANAMEYLVAFFMTVGLSALLTFISTKLLNRESAIFKST
jgi:sodium transport system permease protein